MWIYSNLDNNIVLIIDSFSHRYMAVIFKFNTNCSHITARTFCTPIKVFSKKIGNILFWIHDF